MTAVESGAWAARDLRHNAERAGVAIEIEQKATENFLRQLEKTPDSVLADPPRAGLGKAAVSRLAELKPHGITNRLLRSGDAGGLLEAGYRIGWLTLVDLFRRLITWTQSWNWRLELNGRFATEVHGGRTPGPRTGFET